MADINRPMYEHFGARHLGIKGPGALTSMEEGVFGTVALDIDSDPMYWFLQGIRCFAGVVGVGAGGAATYSKVGLSVETDTQKIICRILGAWIKDPYTGSRAIEIRRCLRTDFSSDPGVRGHATDTRIPEDQESQSLLLKASDALAPGVTLGIIREGLNQFIPTEMPLVVTPKQVIYFRNLNANSDFEMTFVWVEMPAYSGEL